MSAVHAFVDESKQRGFVLVAALVPEGEVAAARRVMRDLLLADQRRIHFKDERPARKRHVLDTLLRLPVTAHAYISPPGRYELDARKDSLRRLVLDVAELGATRLVIEADESTLVHDRRVLYDAVAKMGRDTLEYTHLRAHEDSLLWIPDALAWCWSHGGIWRERIQPVLSVVVDLG